MNKSQPFSPDAAQAIAIGALTFLTGDEARLSRFLGLTGWNPETLATPDSREAILATVLDHLMGDEDLLLTFTANHGLNPEDVALAQRTLSDSGTVARDSGG
ncbi:MAG: DUF3572 domain-containing protein [Methyloligellaceae bacterium]